MSLPSPRLDDRDFESLVLEARRIIQRSCPTWTDLSPSDPGIVLLEVFAHLTEVMLYRLNRLPDKAYVEFLRLIGVRLLPPAAAVAELRWRVAAPSERDTLIPRGTRVAAATAGDGQGEAPVFATARAAVIAAGETEVVVPAFHGEVVEGELVGVATGLPGLVVAVRRPPIVAPTGDPLDLIVAVASGPEERLGHLPVIDHEGAPFRIWREVESFADLGADRYAYRVDRLAGSIAFAPAARRIVGEGQDAGLEDAPRALAEVPAAGREVRVWYRRGGGDAGNVAAGTLTVLKDPILGVEVGNPQPASGGRAAESLENALVRGPQEFHALHRAVTARDYELVARISSRGIARAKAVTSAALWSYAPPGTAEVWLVPHVPDHERAGDRVPAEGLAARATETVRARIERVLEERRPLGTRCEVKWANYKTVRVSVRVVVGRHEDRGAVEARVLHRLYQTISPVPTPLSPDGWPFGRALRASHVYDIALAEPGVLWVDRVELTVASVPDQAVRAIAADAFQVRTWYAGSGAALFRSLNGGAGWEETTRFAGETVTCIRAHPEHPGQVVAVTVAADGMGSRVHHSSDCGETWRDAIGTSFVVRDAAWLVRAGSSSLLLATDVGLYELDVAGRGSPVQLVVAAGDADLGFYAVAVARGLRGEASVAVAAQEVGGVFLSSDGGRPGSFRRIDDVAQGGTIAREDVRVLGVQHDGPRSFLWAGVTAAGGDDPGKGCFRWELRGSEDPPEGWRAFGDGWQGGSCWALASLGTRVFAGSHRSGVVQIDAGARAPTWITPDRNSGLPTAGSGPFPFQRIDALAVDPATRTVMAGAATGVFRSDDEGVSFAAAATASFRDAVALPPTWLFCSGDHHVEVVSDDEAA